MVRSTEEERVYGETRSGAIQGLGPRAPVRHAAATDGSPRWPTFGVESQKGATQSVTIPLGADFGEPVLHNGDAGH